MARILRHSGQIPRGNPLFEEEVVTQLRPRPALKALANPAIELSTLIASRRTPRVETVVRELGGKAGAGTYELAISVVGAQVGVHALRPAIPAEKFVRPRPHADDAAAGFEGYLPDHLPLTPVPGRLPQHLKTLPRLRSGATRPLGPDEHRATTIFAPDQRRLFNDTAFPWCTVGLVQTPNGSGSGTMVGPRHLLTCSHVIQWNSNNTAGWVKFTPAYFDGSAPFGEAWGTRVYWEERKVYGPTIDRSEGQHDYVCVVLDRRIGDLTGWMGTRSWSDDWDGEPYWRHIGYPGDLGGQRPSYQRDISLDGSFWDREVHSRIFHQGDVWPGQSGGPFFAWWAGESWPRVVAVQSGENSDENSASGGAHMVNCVIRARNDHP
jgi:V8-like Glu-specific endopeptidase